MKSTVRRSVWFYVVTSCLAAIVGCAATEDAGSGEGGSSEADVTAGKLTCNARRAGDTTPCVNKEGPSKGREIDVDRARSLTEGARQGEWSICKPGEAVEFNCQTTSGKTISICDGSYRFGHTRNAEMDATGHVEQALIGPAASESERSDRRSEFTPDGKTSYVVWSKGDHFNGTLQGGVIVNGTTKIDCKVGTVIDDRSSLD